MTGQRLDFTSLTEEVRIIACVIASRRDGAARCNTRPEVGGADVRAPRDRAGMNDDRQRGPRRDRVPRATDPRGAPGVLDEVREACAEVHEQPDAPLAEPARSICEAVQRLVAADEDARDDGRADTTRRRS